MTQSRPVFEPLSRLFRGDPAKVRRALDVFQRTTCSDLEQLDRAYAEGDRASIGRLMHKMRSGCMQVGEDAVAEAIQAVERTLHAAAESDAFARAFALARDELDRVQARVAAYLSTESETGEG